MGRHPSSRVLHRPPFPWLPHGASGQVTGHRLLAKMGNGCDKPTLACCLDLGVAGYGRCAAGWWLSQKCHPLRYAPCLGWLGRSSTTGVGPSGVWWVVGGCAPTRQASCPPCHIPRAVARSAMPPYRGIGARFSGCPCFLSGARFPPPHPTLALVVGWVGHGLQGHSRLWLGGSSRPSGAPRHHSDGKTRPT